MQQPQQPAPRRVKITKCSYPQGWYANAIGEEFDVDNAGGVYDFVLWEDYCREKVGRYGGSIRHISKKDCVIVGGVFPLPETYLQKPAEDLLAPASPVEEKARIEDRVEYEKWIKGIINEEMGHGGSASSLAALLTFEFQAHIDAVYEGAAEWESKYKEAQIKLDKLTESKPSPVIEIEEQKGIPEDVMQWIQNGKPNNGFFSPEHLRHWQAGAIDLCLHLATASHPAPAPIVGEREERKYPIGGYAPGNYYCNCVTCKEKFQGDKRAVQCEPCAIKMVEDSGGKDYAHIHVSLPNGATATVSPDASPELLNALTKMVDLAKAMPDAPTEQALPEEVDKDWESRKIDRLAEVISMSEDHIRELQEELANANIRIKELQDWHDSHL